VAEGVVVNVSVGDALGVPEAVAVAVGETADVADGKGVLVGLEVAKGVVGGVVTSGAV
jgi:hypothetical protein